MVCVVRRNNRPLFPSCHYLNSNTSLPKDPNSFRFEFRIGTVRPSENPGADFESDRNSVHFQWDFFSRHVAARERFLPEYNKFVSFSFSIPAIRSSLSLLPPAVSLLLFLPFPSVLPYSSSSFRIAWRGGPAARLTVLGASYTFTPVCAFFRERTCPFHVPLERTRYTYSPFIEYVYTNGQQTDVVDPNCQWCIGIPRR